jgi:serine/threonine protein kinase
MFIFAEKLGSGAYTNYCHTYNTVKGIKVAWNAVKLTSVPTTEHNCIVNEVQLPQRLSHKNIIAFNDLWVNSEKEQYVCVTEILSSGTLTFFVDKVHAI